MAVIRAVPTAATCESAPTRSADQSRSRVQILPSSLSPHPGSAACSGGKQRGRRVLPFECVPTTWIGRHPVTEPTVALRDHLARMGMNLDSDFLRDSIVPLSRC